jgi:hypothetical protein
MDGKSEQQRETGRQAPDIRFSGVNQRQEIIKRFREHICIKKGAEDESPNMYAHAA